MVSTPASGGVVRATDDPTEARVSVIVVDHRRPDLVVDAVAALRAGERAPDEIILVEVEASPADAHPAVVTADEPAPLRRIAVTDNPGYSAACNRGAGEASGEYLLFLNADVVVAPDTLGAVLRVVRNQPDIGIATCRLVLPDGRLDHACHRGIPSVLDALAYKLRLDRLAPRSRRLGRYRLTWLDLDESHDIEACAGAFLLIRRSTFDAVGGWDPGYRFYGEDLDLCLRVRRAGWRVHYVASTEALHLKGGSSHLRVSRQHLTEDVRTTRRWARLAIIESHERFYRRHLEANTKYVLRPFVRLMFQLQRRLAARLA